MMLREKGTQHGTHEETTQTMKPSFQIHPHAIKLAILKCHLLRDTQIKIRLNATHAPINHLSFTKSRTQSKQHGTITTLTNPFLEKLTL